MLLFLCKFCFPSLLTSLLTFHWPNQVAQFGNILLGELDWASRLLNSGDFEFCFSCFCRQSRLPCKSSASNLSGTEWVLLRGLLVLLLYTFVSLTLLGKQLSQLFLLLFECLLTKQCTENILSCLRRLKKIDDGRVEGSTGKISQ